MQEKNMGHICPIGRSRVKPHRVLVAFPQENCLHFMLKLDLFGVYLIGRSQKLKMGYFTNSILRSRHFIIGLEDLQSELQS